MLESLDAAHYSGESDNVTPRDNEQVTEKEIVWLACAIDCEGTISIRHDTSHIKHGGHWYYHPVVSVSNCSLVFANRAVDILRRMGISNYQKSEIRRTKNPDWNDHYVVGVYKQLSVKQLLEIILPELVVKAPQARLVLRFLEKRLSTPRRPDNSIPYSDVEHECYRELATLNVRGKKGRARWAARFRESSETIRRAGGPIVTGT